MTAGSAVPRLWGPRTSFSYKVPQTATTAVCATNAEDRVPNPNASCIRSQPRVHCRMG